MVLSNFNKSIGFYSYSSYVTGDRFHCHFIVLVYKLFILTACRLTGQLFGRMKSLIKASRALNLLLLSVIELAKSTWSLVDGIILWT